MYLPLALVITLTPLACAFIGTGSRSASGYTIHHRLPTLTRTPLPTLTPNSAASPVAVDLPSQSAIPVVATPSLPDNPPAAAITLEAAPASTPAESVPVAPVATPVANSPDASSPAPLPTATLTPAPVSPTDTPIPTATETPLPTDTPTPTATPVPQGWVFNGVRIYSDQYEGGLLLYGNLLNNTGSAQELQAITGAFYDAHGQIIAGTDRIYAYWPGYVTPPGGYVPFEMTVDGINNAANFDLGVEARPSQETPRQDFEVADLNQWNEDDAYCLKGKLRNPAGALQDYLIIAAILYDAQNNVVNFGDYEEFGLIAAAVGDTSEFEICVEPPNQDVARYEIQAWGR